MQSSSENVSNCTEILFLLISKMYELTIILIETEHGIWNLVIKNTDDCGSFDLFIEYEGSLWRQRRKFAFEKTVGE